ncbi:hypothetical protein P3342_008701 [Pyrenophora teres f. teres]|nr:hypothetical protein PTNB29_08255 [Pyrenophora teres f. teres]KAK1910821.1 hypothetical protein P3342_008701 [Pyrenophora teres f. teres]
MNYKFEIPAAMAQAKQKIDRLYDVNVALSMMMHPIRGMAATHLDSAFSFWGKVPKTLAWSRDWIEAVDKYPAYLRLSNDCTEAFPEFPSDRKSRRSPRKCLQRFVQEMATEFNNHVREQLLDVFLAWTKEQMQLFNKGVNKALSDLQWVVYTEDDVVLAGDIPWAAWLQSRQCEELGMIQARGSSYALE